MSVISLERLAEDFRERFPEVAEMLTGPVLTRARELGVPDSYPRDKRALGVAKAQFVNVREEFKTSSHTTDLVQRYWQTRWSYLGRRVGLTLEIPDHGYYQDEIDGLEHMSPRRKLVYGPDPFYQTPEGLILLNIIHPKMRGWVDKPDNALSRVTHSSDKGGGWFHIEADWQTPFTKTTQKGLENVLKGLAEANKVYTWEGQRLPTYIIGSQDSKDLNRHNFDELGWVRLLGSFDYGEVLDVYFDGDGGLIFIWHLGPLYQDSLLGGRFEGAKP